MEQHDEAVEADDHAPVADEPATEEVEVAELVEPEDSHAASTHSSKVERTDEATAYIAFFEKTLAFIWSIIVGIFAKLF